MLLPFSMYSITDAYWIMAISFIILITCFIYQIYTENKFVLLDIEINYEGDMSNIVAPEVANPNEFSFFAVKKTVAYYIREKLTAFIVGMLLIVLYSIVFPSISSHL